MLKRKQDICGNLQCTLTFLKTRDTTLIDTTENYPQAAKFRKLPVKPVKVSCVFSTHLWVQLP